ncbi:hypothetical protein SUGI_0882800 [Cryptomeria japonica]|uniref:RING-H2 finger protein ATL1 n=1 Tax=Cryptomeria japonica TaxID=3369 RepID=UPI002414C7C3|nr:RING-H2 finger protein ATL1 [Cryptomeria japonica]GLJ42589.1 hypothetical protein SUGI_0882800 [Cryptomeria japonica]
MASQANGPFQICCRNGLCPPQWPACPPSEPFARPIDVSHSSDPNFSILVIAILGILATSFLLVSYYAIVTKCYIRWDTLRHHLHGNPRSSDTPNPDSTEPWIPNSNGLEDSVIQSIPIFSYKEQDGILDCAICLSEFQDGETLRLLPKCSHAFHVHCIDVWLQSNSNCPMCRANIVSTGLVDNTQATNNELSVSSDLQNDSFHSERACVSPLQNGNQVSTSIDIDLNEQKSIEMGEIVFSKSPVMSKLTHVSSLNDIRRGGDCYWVCNIQRADGMSTSEQTKMFCAESMPAIRRSFSMDSSFQRLWIDLNTTDCSNSMENASLFFRNDRSRNYILPI